MSGKILFLALILFSGELFAQSFDNRLALNECSAPFFHGVASGDPLTDRIILWTRITPSGPVFPDSIEVSWRIAIDTGMTNIVNSGSGYAYSERDFTFKTDASGLQAGTWYYYDFSTSTGRSQRGRTRTAPSGYVEKARFGVVSCSNYEYGYFNAYAHLKDRNDIDAILHLGDYIYEYETGGFSASIPGRTHLPSNEIITLSDYRARYGHYRLDPDLQNLHQQYPFINIWDDHESANDAFKDGAENHDSLTEGSWQVRKSNAVRAWHEWLPVRTPDVSDSLTIYRSMEWGDLANLYMMDTRLKDRVEQVSNISSSLSDTNRTLIGPVQMNWLINEMSNASNKWNILCQQVMMAPVTVFSLALNTDQWDGYPAERDRLYSAFTSNNLNKIVVLTGDIHTSWGNDLPGSGYDASTGANSFGVEFVTTSVTSPGFPVPVGASLLQILNPHCKYVDLTEHGYLILDVDTGKCQGEWYYVGDLSTPQSQADFAKAMYVNAQESFLRDGSQITGSTQVALQAPECPIPFTGVEDNIPAILITGVYPNPALTEITAQFGTFGVQESAFELRIRDLTGKICLSSLIEVPNGKVFYGKVNIESLSKGMYQLEAVSGNKISVWKFIKE